MIKGCLPQVDSPEAIKVLWHKLVLDLASFQADTALMSTHEGKLIIYYNEVDGEGAPHVIHLRTHDLALHQPLLAHIKKLATATTADQETIWAEDGLNVEMSRAELAQ